MTNVSKKRLFENTRGTAKNYNMNGEEFLSTCQKIRLSIQKRLIRAQKAAKSSKDVKKLNNYLQLLKELYAFDYLIEMCGCFEYENMILRKLVETVSDDNIQVDVTVKQRDPLKIN